MPITDFIHLIRHFESNDLDNDYFLTKLAEVDSMPQREKVEFFQVLAGHVDSLMVNSLSIHAKLDLFKKVLYHYNMLSDNSTIVIFERILSSLVKDNEVQSEILNMITSADEDKIISILAIDSFKRAYNRSGAAFEKLILFSMLGPKVSDCIENQILFILDEETKVIYKPRQVGFTLSRETWKNLALKFALVSPYANIRNIMLSLYKLDKEFVKTKFITRVPECDKYKVLL
jgi:hypothetical protein